MMFFNIEPLSQHLQQGMRLAGLALCRVGSYAAAQPPRASKALFSGYFSNNVHNDNACNGAFERTLDDSGRIRGARPEPQWRRLSAGSARRRPRLRLVVYLSAALSCIS